MNTDGAIHGFGTAASMFDFVTRAHSERTFISWRGRDISYGEMRREVAALGEALIALGLKRGDGVAFLSSSTPETLFSRDAAASKGIFYVALNSLSALANNIALIQAFGIKAVVVDDREHPGALRELHEALPGCIVVGFGERRDGSGLCQLAVPYLGSPFRIECTPDDIIRLGQTGGTTGTPKGVLLNHRVQMSFLLMCHASWDLPQHMRFLSTTPLAHAAGTYAPLAMIHGGRFSILSKFSPKSFQDAVVANRINCTMLVPTQMKRILHDPDIDPSIIGGIETIAYGASPISPEVLSAWLQRFGPNVSQLYGQTESPMCITSLRKSLHSLEHPDRLASCGLPNLGMQVAIMRQDGSLADDNDEGEIVARGPSVMDGYWNRKEETEEAFRYDWLHTGDLGYRDADGFYYIIGRAKDLIISGGFNIYPKEIEDILTRHPSVKDAAIVGVPDSDWGEAVKAFVVLADGATLDEGSLSDLVRAQKGPVYVPKTFEVLESIPVTAVGKPDKKALKTTYWRDQQRAIA